MENAPQSSHSVPGRAFSTSSTHSHRIGAPTLSRGRSCSQTASQAVNFLSLLLHFKRVILMKRRRVKKKKHFVFCLVEQHYSHLCQQSRFDHVPRDTPNPAQDGAPASNSSPISGSKAIISLVPHVGLHGNSSLVCHGYPLRRVCTFPYVLPRKESLN